MQEEKWLKKSLMIFNDIKYRPEYRQMLNSKDVGLPYRFQVNLARTCHLLEKLGRLDDFNGDKIMKLVNSRGPNRLVKVDRQIFELQEELDATKNVSMADWRKKILMAFETGQSDVELSEKLRR